ncbi:MAG TPA: AI-2E family transporter [Gammaproteobacteria bacterium]|nr:AI-2E family transporter [Gammaproteobacteria bacterium]
MSEESAQAGILRILLTAAAVVIVIAGMKAAAPILVPFLLSGFIAIICAPPLFWLERKGLPTILALLVVIAAIVILALVTATLVGSSINDFYRDLPLYEARLRQETAGLLSWLESKGLDLHSLPVEKILDPGAAMKLVGSMLSGLGGVLTDAFMILLTVVFILLEASSFPRKLHTALTNPGASLEHFEQFIHNIQRYMSLKTWISLATGATIATWLTLLGVEYPLLWGMLAFLLNYVPNIGSIIAAVPAIMMAFIQLGIGSALATAGGYLVVNIVVGSIIEPRIMGRGMGLSTLIVFLSLLFWGWVLGPVGMVLSVPLTMIVKIALESRDDTRWFAVLLGPETPVSTQVKKHPHQQTE